MALIRLFGKDALEKVLAKKIVDPSTHVCLVRFNTFTFIPIVTSRHRHYVQVRVRREDGKEAWKTIAKYGFTMFKGTLRFVEVR